MLSGTLPVDTILCRKVIVHEWVPMKVLVKAVERLVGMHPE